MFPKRVPFLLYCVFIFFSCSVCVLSPALVLLLRCLGQLEGGAFRDQKERDDGSRPISWWERSSKRFFFLLTGGVL